MRRLAALLLMFIIALGLMGCGSDDAMGHSTVCTTTQTSNETTTPTEAIFPVTTSPLETSSDVSAETSMSTSETTCPATQPTQSTIHSHVFSSVITEPTCTHGGFTTHSCKCGESYKDSYTDALKHEYGNWYQTKAPTQDAKGEERRDCNNCNASETRSISASHKHEYTILSQEEATCTEQGYTLFICSCGSNYKDDYIEPLGHDWQPANCNHPKTCASCGITEGDILDHTWVEASCAAPKTCLVCGATEGDTLPHDLTEPTCSKGSACRVCGYDTGTETMLPHDYKRSSINCKEDVCSQCGDVILNGHDHDFWFTSCTTPSKCCNCTVDNGIIPGHRFENGKCRTCKISEEDASK